MTNVRDPRRKKASQQQLEDPRLEPNRDLLAVNRRWLKSTRQPGFSRAESRAPFASTAAADELGRANYRYTKNPPVLNDNLGYGEQLPETLWAPSGDDGICELPRTSQRTRTGRQVLDISSRR